MSASKKSSKKKTSKGRHTAKKHSQEIFGGLPPFAGLNIKIEPSKRRAKTQEPKQKCTFEITDSKALEKDLEIKKKLAAMFVAPNNVSTLESYLSSSDPSDALRKARMSFLEFPFQVARLAGEDINKELLNTDKVKAFIEGLELSDSERVEHAKAYFLTSILMFAKLPLDPRREIEFMIEALVQVQKVLPKRKPGPKEDMLIAEAWKKIDREGMKPREAYKFYMNALGVQKFLYGSDYKVFLEKIRKKRSEEKKKQARKAVTTKTKQKRRNSDS